MKTRGRAFRRVIELTTALGWLLCAASILETLEHANDWPLMLGIIAVLIFAPLLRGRASRASMPRLATGILYGVLSLATLTSLLYSGAGILALVIVAIGVAYMHTDSFPHAVVSLIAPVLVASIGLSAIRSMILLGALPISAVLSIIGGMLLHARVTTDKLRRTAADERGVDDPPGEWARLKLAIPLGLAVILLALFGFLTLESVVSTGDASAKTPLPEEAEDGLDADPDILDGDRRRKKQDYQSDLNFGEVGAGALSTEVVMIVRPRLADGSGTLPAPPVREMYLVGATLDLFTEQTITLSTDIEMSGIRDAQDGEEDGWVILEPAASDKELSVLEIEPVLPMRAGSMESVVLAPRGLVAVSLPELWGQPDRYLLTPGDPDSYSLVYSADQTTEAQLLRMEVASVHARYRQLPAESASLDYIRTVGQALTAGTKTEFQRVRAIRDHLRDTFEYDLEGTGFGGTRAIAEFLNRGSGFCTYSAGAMTLMLRTLDVPARVVTGFVAREWSDADSAWIVERRNGHAWVEVPFEGHGWIRFDPTPIARGRGDWNASVDNAFARFQQELVLWGEAKDGEVGLSQLLHALLQIPIQLIGGRPSLLLLMGAAVLAVLAWLRRLRGSDEATEMFGASAKQELPSVQRRLLRALAKLGHRRRKGQTAREFAVSMHGADRELFAPLPNIVEWFYRAHFGGRALLSEEVAQVESFITSLHDRHRDAQAERARTAKQDNEAGTRALKT
ncbi:MAG: transglutaminase-like putative cysteine protease [Planctomycetota bacterium]|jgi:transglutaminase-like putative cysteine protease